MISTILSRFRKKKEKKSKNPQRRECWPFERIRAGRDEGCSFSPENFTIAGKSIRAIARANSKGRYAARLN